MEPTQAHPCTARQLHDLCEASCQVQRASENNIAGQLLRQKNITGSLAPQWTVCIGRFFFKITEQNPSLGKASFVQYSYLERLGGNLNVSAGYSNASPVVHSAVSSLHGAGRSCILLLSEVAVEQMQKLQNSELNILSPSRFIARSAFF